jgi:lipoate-protein ligase A
MQYLDLTLPSPEQNLALDEALLELCDHHETSGVLRFWEPDRFFVVVGYANRVGGEVNVPFCHSAAIPIYRRCTGGGTVLQGPGCLNFSLLLPLDHAVELQSIPSANNYILGIHAKTLSGLLRKHVQIRGHTDLAIGDLKFSGNAQRRRHHALLFHGSFLLEMDLAKIEQCLLLPSQEPDYRLGRSHQDFLMNLEIPAGVIKTALMSAWDTSKQFVQTPCSAIQRLVEEKYARSEWNLKW